METVEAVMAPSKSMKTTLALGGFGQAERAPVDGDEFVGAVVKTVPWQRDVAVGQDDFGEGGIGGVAGTEEPIAVHRVDASGGSGNAVGGSGLLEKGEAGGGGGEEIAAIHG